MSVPTEAASIRLIMLGTGTGVGKTWVSHALAEALRQEGAETLALKPIETGVKDAAAFARESDLSDASVLARVSFRSPSRPPYVFREPISPHLAAKRTGVPIELDRVVAYVTAHQNEMTPHVMSFVIVETAGGCFSPLSDRTTNADLAAALEPAIWILVAPDALGVLHDVTATLAALRTARRDPDYLVLSAARASDSSTGTNAAELRALGVADPIAVLGRDHPSSIAPLARALVSKR
jgi:dethiobiotin synthetase